MDIKAIYDGIYAHFLADSDLKTALGGDSERRMYLTKAPQNATSPYCVFQWISGIIDQTFTSDGEITIFQFSIFNQTDKPRNTTPIDDVFKKLTAAYDDTTLTVSGYTSIAVTRGVANFLPTDDDFQMYVVDYEIRIELN